MEVHLTTEQRAQLAQMALRSGTNSEGLVTAVVARYLDEERNARHERSLVRAAASMSEPSFAAVWDNPEDDVYDAL